MDHEKISQNLVNCCKKEDLFKYCEDYEVDYRINWNKTKLASALEEKLLKTPEILTRFFSQDQFSVIKKMIDAGGTIEADNVIPYVHLILRGLISASLLIDNKARIKLVDDFMEAIAPKIDRILSDKSLQHQDHLDGLICGIVLMYGIISERDLIKILNRLSGEKLTNRDFVKMLLQRDKLAKEIGIHLDKRHFYYHSALLDEPGKLLKEIGLRKDLPYADFTEEEILNCGSQYYFPENSYSLSLRKELERRGMGDADEMIRNAWILTENDYGPGEIMSIFSEQAEFKNIDDINHFAGFVMAFLNGLPRWNLKGHTPEAMFQHEKKFLKPLPAEPFIPRKDEQIVFTSKKPGRNDPCPCGSGKKYKNCCGNNIKPLSLN